MPSPVGHTLIGLAVAVPALVPRGSWATVLRGIVAKWPLLLGAVVLANAPDFDYLPGILAGDLNAYHHYYTHTMGWAVLVAAGLWMVQLARDADRGWRLDLLLLLFLLLSSHLLADWLTDDGRPPYGIMAWWPLDDRFTLSSAPVFMRLHKREWSEFVQLHNFKAVGWELVVCLPLVLAALLSRFRKQAGPI